MTVKKKGTVQKRKAAQLSLAAFALMAAGTAAFGQDSQPTPSTADPATGPATDSAPPRQLRDFRLPPPSDDGRAAGVQGPSNNGLPPVSPNERRNRATPTPTPNIALPKVTPAPSSSASPKSESRQPDTSTPRPQPAPSHSAVPDESPPLPAPTSEKGPSAPAVDSPRDTANPLAMPPSDLAGDDRAATPAPTAPPSFGWLGILAAILVVGAGLWFWRRRRMAADRGPAQKTAKTGRPASPTPSRSAAPVVPKPAPPRPAPPQPAPAATPVAPTTVRTVGGDTEQRIASPLVTRPTAERRAMLTLSLDVLHIHVTPANIAVSCALTIRNQGSAAAVGVLTRVALQQGSAMPEEVLIRFYDGAGGGVLRDDLSIAVGGQEVVTAEVMLPRDGMEPIMMGGKPMAVPVMALDVTYHWDGPADAFGQVAQAFVLGRPSTAGGGRLGALRLDQGNYMVQPAGAQATTMQRRQ